MHRAYAAIDSGIVRLGNGWLERRWSTYTGATTELLLENTAKDCLTKKSPEFHIDYGDQPLGVSDLRESSWSEARDAFGASVILDQRSQDVAIRITTHMAHNFPALVREIEITNTTSDSVPVRRLANDVLPLDAGRFTVCFPETEKEIQLSLEPGSHLIRYGFLQSAKGTLALGAVAGCAQAYFAPNPTYCADVWSEGVTVRPGATWLAPPTTLYWIADGIPWTGPEFFAPFHDAWRSNRQADASLEN